MPRTKLIDQTALTAKQVQVAAILATGANQTEAAEQAGINRATVARYLQLPGFQEELERRKQKEFQAQRDLVDAAQEVAYTGHKEKLIQQLTDLRSTRLAIAQKRLEVGRLILDKIGARILDLPDESIVPNAIGGLLTAADRVIQGGLDDLSDMFGGVNVTAAPPERIVRVVVDPAEGTTTEY